MLKKVLYSILFIVLAAGAVYSYQKVDFGRKTAMFFQVAFGSGPEMGRGPGGPPMGENRGGEMSRPAQPSEQASDTDFQGAPPAMGEGGERGAPPNFQQEGNRGSGPPGGGMDRGPGSVISLGNVIAYTLILAFSVFIIRLLDRFIVKYSRSKQLS